VRKRTIFKRYDYTGPYVTDLGHGANAFDSQQAAFVVQECHDAIKRSDLVFAWIDDLCAYGTFAELGYAKALGKRIWIAGLAEFDDLWFIYQLADRVSVGVEGPERALYTMLTKVVSASAIEYEPDES
jgi:nucleoside 2-deoxyribosyltransferase